MPINKSLAIEIASKFGVDKDLLIKLIAETNEAYASLKSSGVRVDLSSLIAKACSQRRFTDLFVYGAYASGLKTYFGKNKNQDLEISFYMQNKVRVRVGDFSWFEFSVFETPQLPKKRSKLRIWLRDACLVRTKNAHYYEELRVSLETAERLALSWVKKEKRKTMPGRVI